jgi:hypothetical protein
MFNWLRKARPYIIGGVLCVWAIDVASAGYRFWGIILAALAMAVSHTAGEIEARAKAQAHLDRAQTLLDTAQTLLDEKATTGTIDNAQ